MKRRDAPEVTEWLDKAAEDIEAVDVLLDHSPWLLAVVGFHAQQAAEKLLKALITAQDGEPPHTHDLVALIGMLEPAWTSLDPSEREVLEHDAAWLTGFGVRARYPGTPMPCRDPERTSREARDRMQRIKAVVLAEFSRRE